MSEQNDVIIRTAARIARIHPETLRGILSGQRQIPFEAFAELERRLDALTDHGRTAALEFERRVKKNRHGAV